LSGGVVVDQSKYFVDLSLGGHCLLEEKRALYGG
jgi:hypothetical protein